MEREAFERMAAHDRDHWWFVARRKILTQLLDSYRPQAGTLRILEVGCGTGSNIAMLQHYGDVEALEPDDDARAFAQERSHITIQGGYLPDGVRLEDGAYDLIVLFDVLEHIPDSAGALRALKPKLAPGGRMILTVPAMPWLWSAHDVLHHHQRRYTAASLDNEMMANGYRLIHRTHFNSLLFPLIALARLAGKLTGRDQADDAKPGPVVNAILQGIFALEHHWVSRLRIPFGVSLAVVAEPATR